MFFYVFYLFFFSIKLLFVIKLCGIKTNPSRHTSSVSVARVSYFRIFPLNFKSTKFQVIIDRRLFVMSTLTVGDVALDERSSLVSTSSLDDSGLTPELIEAGYVDVTPDKDGGVLKLVLQQGIGTELPIAHDHIFIHYTASLIDGKQYHDSRKQSRPFIFIVGRGMQNYWGPLNDTKSNKIGVQRRTRNCLTIFK